MAKRPRPHILEDESRNHFQTILPPHWVFRHESPDYGIDGSVEIFNEEGESTGLRFFVQLKATDSKDRRTQRTMRFQADTLIYWRKQKHLTLLARYCSYDKNIYWSWHFDRRINKTNESKTASIQFEDKDIWNPTTPEKIRSQLDAATKFIEKPTSLPISLKIPAIHTSEEVKLDETLREEFSNISNLIKYGDLRADSAAISISIKDGLISVDFEGFTSYTFPVKIDSPSKISSDILVAISTGFSNLGKGHLVRKLIEHAYKNSTLIAHPYFTMNLAQALSTERDFPMMRKIASHLTETVDFYPAASAYAFMPTMVPVQLTNEERNEHESFLINHILRVKERFPKSLGLACYNTAEFLLINQRLRPAFHYFRLAARHDVHYAKASYVWLQAAGILFRKGRYRAAAHGYASAMQIEKPRKPASMALFADTQLHRGHIGSAIFWLKNALNREGFKKDPRFGIFHIQLLAAQKIVEILRVTRIRIQTLRAIELTEQARLCDTEEAERTTLESVYYNPAAPATWSMLAKLASSRNDFIKAQYFAMIAASLSDSDPYYWMDLIVNCIFTQSKISDLILAFAFMNMSDSLAKEAYRRSANTSDEKQRSFFRQLGQYLSQLPEMQTPRTIRIRHLGMGTDLAE